MLVDKPSGPSSHDVVDAVRRAAGVRRVGHAGTLDPFASGLLLVLVGRTTRLSQYMVGLGKSYTGRIRLGVQTDTDDASGLVTAATEAWRTVETAEIERVMASLTGRIVQRPPTYSAKKTGGERAYRLARRGRAVVLDATEVDVGVFHLVRHEESAVEFHAEVGSGTYIRALARDLGAGLGCGAHLEALRRTRVGTFGIEDAVSLEALDGRALPLRSAGEAVHHLPRRDMTREEFQLVRHGRPLLGADQDEGPVALGYDGDLIAVAESVDGLLKPRVVLVHG